MDNQIIYAAISIGGIGAVLGAVLAYAAKVFYVAVDPKVEQIGEALPGVNCGACGYAGCGGYADAIVNAKADVSLCAPGGPDVSAKIAGIMGVAAGSLIPMSAYCACQGTKENAKDKLEYYGPKSCSSAVYLSGGHKACDYGCLGFGDCAVSCKFDALYIDQATGLPVVDKEKCTGCSACLKACPKGVMKLAPKSAGIILGCNSRDKGKEVMDVCKVGCIGCKICSLPKTTPSGAIKMNGNLPVVDYLIEDDLIEAKTKCPKGCFVESK